MRISLCTKTSMRSVTVPVRYVLLRKKAYCSGQVNWDASKLLTQKNMYPELGHRALTQNDFRTTLIIFPVFLISLIDTLPEIKSHCTVHS